MNLFDQQLSQIQTYSDFENIEAYKRTIQGLVFGFIDDRTETASENSHLSKHRRVLYPYYPVSIRQVRGDCDIDVFAAYMVPIGSDQGKLCGIEVRCLIHVAGKALILRFAL